MYFQKLFCLVLFLTGFSLNSHAQSLSIQGKVSDNTGPLAFATVVLNNSVDSTLVKANLTDDNGEFVIENLPSGSYTLEVRFLGMETYNSGLIELRNESLVLDPITLKSDAYLKEVTIVAQKELVVVKADKMVFNVEGTISASGNNGLELLRKCPGVIVDNSNNIIVEGKVGVQIFIDGRPSPLAGDALTNYLQSLQSSDIEAIEVITQPSSRYDAAGSAGIINIRLKKNKNHGTNGTAGFVFFQGVNARYSPSISLNNRTASANVFGSYNAGIGKRTTFIDIDRIQEDVLYRSSTDMTGDYMNQNFRVGADFYPAKNHTFGVLVSGNLSDMDRRTESSTSISEYGSNEIYPELTLIADNQDIIDNTNLFGNINYQFADTSGHKLNIDADYGVYSSERLNIQPNSYQDGQTEEVLYENNYEMNTPSTISLFSVKADYEQNLWGGNLSAGVKHSNITNDNSFEFYNVFENEKVFNEERSNEFKYTERIDALYLNYARSFTKWSFQAGLRAERTISKGELTTVQNTDDKNVERDYLNMFPSGGITYSTDGRSSWALYYSKRIQRPSYQSLNPFESQIDELSFVKGNPFLQPQYTDNVRLSRTFKSRVSASLSYSFVHDFFAQITDTLGTDKSFMMQRNIANQETWNIGVSAPISITKWWGAYVNVNASRTSYAGYEEKFQPIEINTLYFFATNNFTLPKGIKLEVSGRFSTPSVWGGTYITNSLGAVNLAVQKKFAKDKLTLRLAVNDIFLTSLYKADMQYGDLVMSSQLAWENRNVNLNLNYSFGNSQVKSARKRKTATEDSERTRID